MELWKSLLNYLIMICGFGINDADYVVQIRVDGKKFICPYYLVWQNMLIRCYSESEHKRHPTYVGCEVCPEWKYFSQFRSWMKTQDWEGKQLDKDILGNKLYSPKTCCFVPQWLNLLFNNRGRARGKDPLGVYRRGNKFEAQIRINGKLKHLGKFRTQEEAHSVYLQEKKQYVQALIKDYPDQRVKEAVLCKADELT